MSNIILLFLCMLIGITLRRFGRVPENAHAAINGFIINVSLPALTLLQIHGIKLQSTLGYAVAIVYHCGAFLLERLETLAVYACYHRRTHPSGWSRQHVLRWSADAEGLGSQLPTKLATGTTGPAPPK
jgi:hypothetical protein